MPSEQSFPARHRFNLISERDHFRISASQEDTVGAHFKCFTINCLGRFFISHTLCQGSCETIGYFEQTCFRQHQHDIGQRWIIACSQITQDLATGTQGFEGEWRRAFHLNRDWRKTDLSNQWLRQLMNIYDMICHLT